MEENGKRMILLLLLTGSAIASSPSLFDALRGLRFLNAGEIRASDATSQVLLPVHQEDTEPENVTVNPYTYQSQGPWAFYGQASYLFYNVSDATCVGGVRQVDMDRHGGDITALSSSDPSACVSLCCARVDCDSWVFAAEAPSAYFNCSAGAPCCYLKAGAPPVTPNPGIYTGIVNRSGGQPVPPPLGLRSAVPLGGVGAGSFELRGDGTFHGVTIINQSPASSAKYGVLADMLLGVRCGEDARAVRTQPPAYARAGIAQLTYSGSHPVSRLTLGDPSLPPPLQNASIHAFSTLVPGDMAASATPAVVFSLSVENPTSQPVNVSFFLSLPFAAVNDCFRNGTETGITGNFTEARGYAACAAACLANVGCASWSYLLSSLTCLHNRFLVSSYFLLGSFCGVPGTWSSDGQGSLTLSFEPPGYQPTTARGNRSSGVGDITLRGVLEDGGGGGVGSASVSLLLSDDPAALFSAFSTEGVEGSTPAGEPFTNVTAAHGAGVVRTTLAAGSRAALS